MGWLRLVGSLKLWVSFAKEPYKRDNILQKKPMILRSVPVEATPYMTKQTYLLYILYIINIQTFFLDWHCKDTYISIPAFLYSLEKLYDKHTYLLYILYIINIRTFLYLFEKLYVINIRTFCTFYV